MKRHRTQLHLDDDQYRWLRRKAGPDGSMADVVRRLIDEARTAHTADDPLIRFLLGPPLHGKRRTSVQNIDDDLYG